MGKLLAFSSGNSFPFHFGNGPEMDSAQPTVAVGVCLAAKRSE